MDRLPGDAPGDVQCDVQRDVQCDLPGYAPGNWQGDVPDNKQGIEQGNGHRIEPGIEPRIEPVNKPRKDPGIEPGQALRGAPGDPARVVLFSREGCHLCDDARAVVARICTGLGAPWREVDIDTGPDAAGLRDQYGDYVPVVEVDGVQQGFWRIDAARLERVLVTGGR